MTDRISCIVPFCRRTSKAGKWREWICSPHYRNVPMRLKSLKRRVYRRYERIPSERNAKACIRVWERVKQKAVVLQ